MSMTLIEAVRSGDFDAIKRLLDAGADPNESAGAWVSCVFVAAETGAIDVLRLLLERGASPGPGPGSLDPYAVPLFAAAQWGHLDCVRALIDAGASATLELDATNALTHVGSPKVAEYLWEQGVRLIPNENGYDAIQNALNEDNLPVLRFFLSKIDPATLQERFLDACGWFMKPDAVRLFLEFGADPCKRGSLWTPFHWACWQGDGNNGRDDADTAATIQLLIEAGADPNMAIDGVYPLHFALTGDWSSPTSARVLLRNGAKVDAPFDDGSTPLMVAARKGDAEMVAVLLEFGANRHRKDEQGRTALDFAQKALAEAMPAGPTVRHRRDGPGWTANDRGMWHLKEQIRKVQETIRLLSEE